MTEYKWKTDQAIDQLNEKNVHDALPPCPNCGAPSRLRTIRLPRQQRTDPTEETCLECTAECWRGDPEAYLTAVANEGLTSFVDVPAEVTVEDVVASVESPPEVVEES